MQNKLLFRKGLKMAAKMIIMLFYFLVVLNRSLRFDASTIPKHTCSIGWIYLPKTKKCLRLEEIKRPFNHTKIKCSDYSLGSLANLEDLHVEDQNILTTKLTNYTSFWSLNKTVCSIAMMVFNKSWKFEDCSKNKLQKLHFLCETSSYDKEIGLEYLYRKKNKKILPIRMTSSSHYSTTSSFNLLNYRPEYGTWNSMFNRELFFGKGWCSKTTNDDEYFKITFDGIVELSGFKLQHGLVDECKIWIENFTVKYYAQSRWLDAANLESSHTFTNNNNESMIWFNSTVICESLLLTPVSSKSSCASYPDIHCLRIEIYGRFLRVNFIPKIVAQEDLIISQSPIADEFKLPAGPYAIVTSPNNCPESFQNTSYGYSLTRFPNAIQKLDDLPYTSALPHIIKENICLRRSTYGSNEFPNGSYCILSERDMCPNDFSTVVIAFGVSYVGFYNEKEQIYHIEESSTNIPAFFTPYQSFCCRNDSMKTKSINEYAFEFMSEPFILYPITDTCQMFVNIKTTLKTIEYKLPPIFRTFGRMSPYYVFNNTADLLQQYLCVYEPLNFVDKLVFTVPLSNYIYSTFVEFELFVTSTSHGRRATTGVDSNGIVTVFGNICPESSFNVSLVEGARSIKLMVCKEGTSIIKGKMTTTNGSNLYAETVVNFSTEYSVSLLLNTKHINNAIDFSNCKNITNVLQVSLRWFEHATDIYDIMQSVVKVAYKLFKQTIIAIQPGEFLDLLTSLGEGFQFPVLIYEPKLLTTFMKTEYTRHMTISPTNRFLNTLFEISKNSTGVVIFRIMGVLSLAEFYAMYISKIRIIKDIVLTTTIEDNDFRVLKNNPGCDVLLFLNSALTSAVLGKAIDQKILSNKGYRWYSFAPNFVISNTFLRENCLSKTPPCYQVLKDLRNIFFERLDGNCKHPLSIINHIENKSVNISTLIEEDLPLVAAYDMVNITAQFVEMSHANQTSISTENYLRYIDSLQCLPSGSGLVFYSLRQQREVIKAIRCQTGWTGILCNAPVCSLSSCNLLFGTCIAPETCLCVSGHYGRGCNANCELSCINGVCNDGMLGDGKCKYCYWPYLGDDCSDNSIIYGFVAAAIGTVVVGFFLTMYILRYLQTREQTAEAEIEANEKDCTMKWSDFFLIEDIKNMKKSFRKQLKKKLNYTSYKRGYTFSGYESFIKCYHKPNFELSLALKNELSILSKFDHENMESILGLVIGEPIIGIVTDISYLGSLYDVLHEEYIPITWDVKYSVMQDICRGMSYLHDVMKMQHGRLKSTNCILHRGWLVKLGDIGLKKIKNNRQYKAVDFEQLNDEQLMKKAQKRRKSSVRPFEEEEEDSDYNSLLWTAPELLSKGVTNLDQILRSTNHADIYSFGIIMSEIISRQPPFSDCTVMSIPYIVHAVAHIKETVLNFGQINTNDLKGTTVEDIQNMQNCLLRPAVEESSFPADETERSILRTTMENCWSEQPAERPPFSYLLEIFEILTPLKGSQTLKRAVLLQRETESFEQYIAHDTQKIVKEKIKYHDLLMRTLPTSIYLQVSEGIKVRPCWYEDVTIMAARLCNFIEILNVCSPTEAVSVIDYMSRVISVIISNHFMNITEVENKGDYILLGSGFPDHNKKHLREIVALATKLVNAVKDFKLPQFPLLPVSIRVGLHTGSVFAAVIETKSLPKYCIFGDVIKTAQALEKECNPNYVHTSKRVVSGVNLYEYEIQMRPSFKMKIGKMLQRTYWILDKKGI